MGLTRGLAYGIAAATIPLAYEADWNCGGPGSETDTTESRGEGSATPQEQTCPELLEVIGVLNKCIGTIAATTLCMDYNGDGIIDVVGHEGSGGANAWMVTSDYPETVNPQLTSGFKMQGNTPRNETNLRNPTRMETSPRSEPQ